MKTIVFKYFTVIAICNRYLAFLLPISANLSKQFTIQIKGWSKLPLRLQALLCCILKANNRRKMPAELQYGIAGLNEIPIEECGAGEG